MTGAGTLQVGGAEANVAAACARLGLSTAWISALPANEWGERVRRYFTAEDIALRAYFIAEKRQQIGQHGTPESDWLEAERQLRTESAN